MARNYRKEYDKFQDSAGAIKKRTALNRMNYKKGTYGNEDGLDVSHTEDGIRLEKSSTNKGRKEKSRMKGSARKQQGGYLKGPSHDDGGMAAIIDGEEPVELEGGEYIIKKSSAKKLGKSTLDKINKKGRIPTMAKGGKVKKDKVISERKFREMDFSKDAKKNQKKLKSLQKQYDEIPDPEMTSNKRGWKLDSPFKHYVKKTSIGKKINKLRDKQETADEALRKGLIKKVKVRKVPKTKASGGQVKKYEEGDKIETSSRKRKSRRGPDYEKNVQASRDKKETRTAHYGTWKDRLSSFMAGETKAEFKKDKQRAKEEMEHWNKYKGINVPRGSRPGSKVKKPATVVYKNPNHPKYNTPENQAKLKSKDTKKKQMGGQVAGGYRPTAPVPARSPFKQGMRMMGHGGQTSVSNDKAGAGDVHTTYSHSGYKAGE